jgi:hypothetical protein
MGGKKLAQAGSLNFATNSAELHQTEQKTITKPLQIWERTGDCWWFGVRHRKRNAR